MAAGRIFLELSDNALETYRNLILSLIANSDGVEYTPFPLYRDIEFTVSKKSYPALKYSTAPFDMSFVSGIVDSFNSVNLEEETRKSYLNLISQLWEYQDNPENNQAFKDKIYSSVLENSSIVAFVIYNRETEGRIEKEIIGRLVSFREDISDFSYLIFSRAIKDFVDDMSWNGYHLFDSQSFKIKEKIGQMRCYGLLEYDGEFPSKAITVTDLGESVFDVLEYLHLNKDVYALLKKV